ncbi:MAG: hypothetical protein ABSD62_12710 [Candidatus Limnocylindrales bacterium]|jgi:hypothetical protein
MLWTAGQRRVTREGRERLAELYVGVRDGYVAGNVATGKAKARGGAQVPSYLRPDPEQRRAMASRGLRQLLADFPAFVARGTEFTH